MTEFDYAAWIVAKYEETVRQHQDGLELEKSMDAVAHALLDAVETGDAPAPAATYDWAAKMTAAAVSVKRKRSRALIKKDVEYLLEAFADPENSIQIEPMLDHVFPLGSHDGRDKALRYWTVDDFTASAMERYRNAAAVAEAAREYEEVVSRAVERMKRAHAIYFGDALKIDR